MADSSTHDPGTRQTGSCFIIYSQKSGSHPENGEAKRSPAIKMDDDLLELYNERSLRAAASCPPR